MWPWDEQMQAFKALSYRDKLRVSGCLRRGEAPTDPRLAVAAVELAEGYQRQSALSAAVMRWFPAIVLVVAGVTGIADIVESDRLGSIFNGLVVLGSIWHLMVAPASWPKHRTRSLEASRRIAPLATVVGEKAP